LSLLLRQHGRMNNLHTVGDCFVCILP